MDKETAQQRSEHMLRVCNALLRERRGIIGDENGVCPKDGTMSAHSYAAKMFLLAYQVSERNGEAYGAAIKRLEEKLHEWEQGPPPAEHIFPREWRCDYVKALRDIINLAKRNLDS